MQPHQPTYQMLNSRILNNEKAYSLASEQRGKLQDSNEYVPTPDEIS